MSANGDDESVSSYGSDFGTLTRPTTIIYSCVTRIAGKPVMLSFWADEGSDEVLLLGLDTSTAMCGELWLTKTEYEILGYPPRSKLRKGKVVSEKRHGKTGPFSSTAEKLVCQAIRKKLSLLRQDDDQLYLQASTITAMTIESPALRSIGLKIPELNNRWLLVTVEQGESPSSALGDTGEDGWADAGLEGVETGAEGVSEGPSLKFCGYDPVDGATYTTLVPSSVWGEKLGVGPLTSLTREQKLVLCRQLCTAISLKDGVMVVEPKIQTPAIVDFRRVGGASGARGSERPGAGVGIEAAAMLNTPDGPKRGVKDGAIREVLNITRTMSAMMDGDRDPATAEKAARINGQMRESPGRQEAEKRHAEMVEQLSAIDAALAERDVELEALDAQVQEKQTELAARDADIAEVKKELERTQQELGAKLVAQQEETGKQSERAEQAEEETRRFETELQAARSEVEAKSSDIEGKLRKELAALKIASAAAAEDAEVREAALLAELAERDEQIKGLSYLVGRLERKAKASPLKEQREGGGLTPALDRAERQAAERAQGAARAGAASTGPSPGSAGGGGADAVSKPSGVDLDKAGVFELQ
mmetsp:Transcript_73965/g.211206  ORF Transcript_73965/g.211206 Transcript_73965/m.211206 type:complete len:591 (+) Transcript_73965:434-2206(+)